MPYQTMTTVLEALIPTKLTAQQCGPLIDATTELFKEYWNGELGVKILVTAHNSLKIRIQACTKWQVNLRRADSSATHAAKL